MFREKPRLFNPKAYGLSISDGHKECQCNELAQWEIFHLFGGVGLWEQHGEDECYLNIIQTCAIRLWPKVVPSSSPLLSLPSFFLSSAVLHNFVLPQKWMQSEFFSSIKFCMIYMVFSVIKKVSCNFFLNLRIIKFGSFWICLYIDRLRSLR